MMVEWTDMTRIEPRAPGAGRPRPRPCRLDRSSSCSAPAFWPSLAVRLAFLVGAALLARGACQTGYGLFPALSMRPSIVLVPPMVRAHPDLGLLGLLWMFAVVWATDIAAYFTGRTFGRPEALPASQPQEDLVGLHRRGRSRRPLAGFLVAWIGAALWRWSSRSACGNAVILSIVASVASQIGDLGESALKRHCDVKDSSHLIPGHGGVMDRLDGFWAVSLIVGFVLF